MYKAKKMIYDVWDEGYSTGLAIFLCVLIIVGALAWTFGMMCLHAWITMLLWNWIAVSLFDAPVLSFWVAFGLRWLCSLLFKSRVTVEKKE